MARSRLGASGCVIAAAIVAGACSGGSVAGGSTDGGEGDSADAAKPHDAGAAHDAAEDVGVDALASCELYPSSGGGCNALPLFNATVVEPTCASGDEPPPTGGTIANGIYILQSSAYYGGCPGTMTSRITWSICGSQWQSAQEADGVDTPENALASYGASTTSVALTFVCPTPGASTYGYDATSSTLALHVPVDTPSGTYVRVDTFAMQ